MKTAAQVAAILGGAKKLSSNSWTCRCPVHDDAHASLSVSDGEDGALLVHCHAGCEQSAVFSAVRQKAGLNGERVEGAHRKQASYLPARHPDPVDLKHSRYGVPSNYWVYNSVQSTPLMAVARYDPPEGRKQIIPWTWDGARWIPKAHDKPRPLYNLPKIAKNKSAPVIVTEGEKAAVAASKVFPDHVATTWAGGAAAVRFTDWTALKGRSVILIPDHDAPGMAAMSEAREILAKVCAEVRMLTPPEEFPSGWDIADPMPEGWTAERLFSECLEARNRFAVEAHEWLSSGRRAEWVVPGIMQRGHVVALTGQTNAGKTGVSVYMALCLAAGLPIAGIVCPRIRVYILCGENPDGFRARLLATAIELGIRPADLAGWLWITDRAFGLQSELDRIRHEIDRIGGVSLVLVDTNAAYFGYEKEDDNVMARNQAMDLRSLTSCAGNPTVLANCHPTKGAMTDNLIPRGGSAFVNEIDCNLTVCADSGITRLHWERKKRGPDFEPIEFEFLERKVEIAGGEVETVVAMPVGEQRANALASARTADEDALLSAMLRTGERSYAAIARACGWLDRNGGPIKNRAFRVVERLKSDKLIGRNRHGIYLTDAGKEEARRIR